MHTDPAHDHTSPRRRQRVTYHTLQEGWRILDFLSHHPESCHILTWLLDGALLTSTALSAPSFSTACRCMCNQHSGFAWVVKRAPNTETLLRRHRHPEELPPDARLWRAHVQDDHEAGKETYVKFHWKTQQVLAGRVCSCSTVVGESIRVVVNACCCCRLWVCSVRTSPVAPLLHRL